MTSRVVQPEMDWMELRMQSGDMARWPRQRGFTYIAILIAIAIIGATLASAGVVWHTAQQRERERELLDAGDQFRLAIEHYYNAGPRQYPQRLEDLLRDPRQPGVVRYIRKIYYDPITGTTDWGLIKTTDDRIMGVYSRSQATPIKQSNFTWADREFEGKSKYSLWTFVYQPNASLPLTVQAPAAAAPTPPTPQGKQWSSTNY